MDASKVIFEVLVIVEGSEAVVDSTAGWFLLEPGAVLSSCAAELTYDRIGLTVKVVQGNEQEKQPLESDFVRARAVRSEFVVFPLGSCYFQLLLEGIASRVSQVVVDEFLEAIHYASDIVDSALIHKKIMEVGQELKTQAVVEVMVVVGVRVRR